MISPCPASRPVVRDSGTAAGRHRCLAVPPGVSSLPARRVPPLDGAPTALPSRLQAARGIGGHNVTCSSTCTRAPSTSHPSGPAYETPFLVYGTRPKGADDHPVAPQAGVIGQGDLGFHREDRRCGPARIDPETDGDLGVTGLAIGRESGRRDRRAGCGPSRLPGTADLAKDDLGGVLTDRSQP
jgi:hypothetical protein